MNCVRIWPILKTPDLKHVSPVVIRSKKQQQQQQQELENATNRRSSTNNINFDKTSRTH